jgi:hypothetical protein
MDDLRFNQGRLSVLKALENMPVEIENELERFEEEDNKGKQERKKANGRPSVW